MGTCPPPSGPLPFALRIHLVEHGVHLGYPLPVQRPALLQDGREEQDHLKFALLAEADP